MKLQQVLVDTQQTLVSVVEEIAEIKTMLGIQERKKLKHP